MRGLEGWDSGRRGLTTFAEMSAEVKPSHDFVALASRGRQSPELSITELGFTPGTDVPGSPGGWCESSRQVREQVNHQRETDHAQEQHKPGLEQQAVRPVVVLARDGFR